MRTTALILLLTSSGWAGAQWSEIGSGLPRTIAGVTSLAIDSATPSTLYAVDINGRLFKSTDGGGSWQVRGSVNAVSFVAVDPKNSSTIYAATQRGVFKSTDGGQNWAAANSGLTENRVSMIVIDPVTPATLYAADANGIYKSLDAARSWNKLDNLPSEAYAIPKAPYYFSGGLTIDPVTPSTLYADVTTAKFSESIFKSTDGGQSWNELYNLPGTGFSPGGLAVDPIDSSTLYARSSGPSGNVSRSTDGGQTWTLHQAAPADASVLSFAIDPASPSTVYAVYSSSLGWGILKSVDSGENWSVLNTGLPPHPDPVGGYIGHAYPVLAVSPTTPTTVYTGYLDREIPGGRLAKSTDGGVTWNAVDGSLTYADVRAVAIDPVVPSNIYAGMGGAAYSIPLFKSADGGASWTSLAQFPAGGYAYGWISSLLVGSASPNVIYAAENPGDWYGGVFKTTDGGANWIITDLRAEESTVMALDASNPNTLYVGDYDPYGCGEAWVDKSVDGGSTWTQHYEWPIGPVNALVTDPKNLSTLYAGTPEGVFKSADGGANWSNIGLSMGVTSLALDVADPNTIYAAAGGNDWAVNAGFLGMFKSTDGGATWTSINSGLARVLDSRSTVNALAMAPYNRGILYAATSGRGIYKSLDGGGKWEPLNEGLTNVDVRLLAVTSNVLYAVTSSGIFKAIDDGSQPSPWPPRSPR